MSKQPRMSKAGLRQAYNAIATSIMKQIVDAVDADDGQVSRAIVLSNGRTLKVHCRFETDVLHVTVYPKG